MIATTKECTEIQIRNEGSSLRATRNNPPFQLSPTHTHTHIHSGKEVKRYLRWGSMIGRAVECIKNGQARGSEAERCEAAGSDRRLQTPWGTAQPFTTSTLMSVNHTGISWSENQDIIFHPGRVSTLEIRRQFVTVFLNSSCHLLTSPSSAESIAKELQENPSPK